MNNFITKNPVSKILYGFFPEIPGNTGRVEIDSDWVRENVAEYKKLGKTLESCDADLTVVVSDELFFWETPEMKAKFHEDIAAFFAQ